MTLEARGWRDDAVAVLLVALVFGPGALCLAAVVASVGSRIAAEAQLPLVVAPEVAAGGVALVATLVVLVVRAPAPVRAVNGEPPPDRRDVGLAVVVMAIVLGPAALLASGLAAGIVEAAGAPLVVSPGVAAAGTVGLALLAVMVVAIRHRSPPG